MLGPAMSASRAIHLALALAALAVPLRAAGQAAITAQDRSVDAASESFGSIWQENQNPFFPDFEGPALTLTEDASDAAAAPGAGPFDATASSVDPLLLIVAPQGSAMAAQTSALGPAAFTASGSFSANAHSRTLTPSELAAATTFFHPPVPYDFGILSDDEQAASGFSVSFTVSSPTPYTLDASAAVSALEFIVPIQGFELTAAAVDVELAGPSGVVASLSLDQLAFCDSQSCFPGSDALQAQGTLAPGGYTLSASATGTALGTCTEVPGFTSFQCYVPAAGGSFELSLALDPAAVPGLPADALALLATALAGSGAALGRPTKRPARSDRPCR